LTAHFLNNRILYITVLLWISVGYVSYQAAIILVPVMALMFIEKSMLLELFIGTILVVGLSDNFRMFVFAWKIKSVLVLMYTVPLIYRYSHFYPFNTSVKPFLIFFTIATLCLPFSLSIFQAAQKTLSYFLIIFVTANYVEYFIKNEKERFLKAIIFYGALILFLGIIGKFTLPGLVHMAGRYRGLFGNPNGMGAYSFLYLIIYTIVKYYYPLLFSRREVFIIYLLIIISVLLCQSRGSMTAMLIFLFTSLLKGKSSGLMIAIALIGAVLYVGVIQNIENIIIFFGLESYLRIQTLETGSGRLVAWEFTWGLIKEHMWYGGGFDYTNDLFSQNKEMLHDMGHQGKAHQTLLTIWLDTGIFGLIFFIYAWTVNFIKAGKLSEFALPVALSVLFSINVESWLAASLNPFTIIFVTIVSLISNPDFVKNSQRMEIETNLLLEEENRKL